MQRSKGGTQGRGVKLKPILPAVKRPPEKGTSDKPLTGRVFYLDIPSKLLSEKFEKDIKDLGGTVEGFLSKEISCLITSKKEAKCAKSLKYSCSLSSPEPAQNTGSSSARAGSRRGGIQEERSNKKPEKDDVSRGKSLLKKVIKEQEILPKNSILANAWNWGVRILHVDDAKIYIEQKKRLGQQAKPAEAASKTVVKQPVKRKAKAQKLKSPFIKVEDSTCQYRPLYLVLPCFRSFQSPPSKPCQSVEKKAATANKATETKQGLNKTWHGQDGANNSHCKMREQKKRGYCECCLQKYDDLEAHLVSQTHTNFSQGPYYQDVDNLISMFDFDFVDWSVYRQEAKSSAMLLPTVTVKWEEKEISDRYLRMSQKISSPVKQTPEAIQRTESEVPLAAAANDGLVNNHIPSPEPMESSICPVQTLGNNASATDSEADPPGMPAFLPVTENSRLPEGETITVCDKDINKKITRSLEHTPQELTLGLLVTAPAIRKCSLEHGDGIPSKRIKLDGSLVSATLCSEPVDADHVTGPKAIDRLPGGLEACVEPVDADHVTSPKAIDRLPEGLEACDEPVDSDHVTSPKAIDCLPGGLEACAEPVDADRVTSPKPVVETIPAGLETACPSNDSDASHHQSPHSSPKLQRKVKQVPRKIRKPEDLPSTPVCKVSVPMEEDFEFSSSRERLLSLFDSSGAESEFCGFSCKSESLPHSVRLENEQPPSRGDFHWCFFSTTSSSAGTFHGF